MSVARLRTAALSMLVLATLSSSCSSQPSAPGSAPSATTSAPVAQPVTSQPATTGTTTTNVAGRTKAVNPAVTDNKGGVTVRATSITVAPDEVHIDVVVVNGSGTQISLNNGPDYPLELSDNHGGRYAWVPSAGNEQASVEKNKTLRGTLVFAGALDPTATSVDLRFNNGQYDSDDRSRPSFTLEIPVPE